MSRAERARNGAPLARKPGVGVCRMGTAAELAEARSFVRSNARGLHALLQREGVPKCPHHAAAHADVSAWLWSQRRKWYFLWLY